MTKRGEKNTREVSWQKKFLVVGILALMIFLSYKIIQPYIITLITTFILAYMIHPLYKILSKKIPKSLSAIICIIVVAGAVIIPSIFIVGELNTQISGVLSDGKFMGFVNDKLDPFLVEKLDISISDATSRGLEYISQTTKDFVLRIPFLIISAILMIFGIFYLLVYWKEFGKHIKKFMPVKEKSQLSKELKEKSNAIIFGSILIALLEGVVSFIGFSLIGVNLALLFSILIFFLAFIPGIGSAVVWIPLTLYYFMIGETILGFLVLGIGIILGYVIDAFLRAKLLGKNTGINPFIMLLGIFGGVAVFGIFGFIIGPLVLVYTIKIVEGFLSD